MARPRKAAAEKRSAPLSVRVTPDLHERLRAASEEASRTISQEIELRLRESFNQDQRFGGPFLYALFRVLAERISEIEHQTGAKWHKDRFTYDQVKDCVDGVVEHFRPRGRAKVPARLVHENLTEKGARAMGSTFARDAVAVLEMALRNPDGAFATYFTAAGPIVGKLKKSALATLGAYAEDVVGYTQRRKT